MKLPRRSGILLHPTSLPGRFGIGDLGPQAFGFTETLASAGQTYWQMLPLGPTGYGDSPYQSFSAFAGNTLLISPELLAGEGLISQEELANAPFFPAEKVDFGAVTAWKTQILAAAAREFAGAPEHELRPDLEIFCRVHAFWLNDYALFRAVRAAQQDTPWYKWPLKVRKRDAKAVAAASLELREQIDAEKFAQYIFFRQWHALKEHANGLGIKIIGDIPIFVALDSADVWCNQDKFKLNEDGSPKVVAGVPPDFFSKTGQLWGNPIYDWDAMSSDGFHWWVARVQSTLQMVDVARIDHFRGFAAAWEVPGKDKTAEHGDWKSVPGTNLFDKIKAALGEVPLIAEDLGVITPDVIDLRDRFNLPGMKVLQFAFGGDASNQDLPHNYGRHSVVYTGTHDNDTSAGWFSSLDDRTRSHVLEYLASDGSNIAWKMVRAAWASVADTAIVPLQDILGLGSEARMNLPASAGGNWNWRMNGQVSPETTAGLKRLTELYGRIQN